MSMFHNVPRVPCVKVERLPVTKYLAAFSNLGEDVNPF